MLHTDIGTGTTPSNNYSTEGPNSSLIERTDSRGSRNGFLYYAAFQTCGQEELERLAMGIAVVKDWVVVG
jgi:hypothetical protein